MRIAICLSGLLRTYRETYQNFLNNLIKPNAKHHIDIFISTWATEQSNVSMERTRRVWSCGDSAALFPEESIDYNDIKEKYYPAAMHIEQQLKFNDSWYAEEAKINPQALMSMAYKIYSCDNLRLQYERIIEPYDCVIRARFDNLFVEPIDVEQLDLSVVTVPYMRPHFLENELWVNDQFAVGNGKNMELYSQWYHNIVPLIARGIIIQPETLLYYHLLENGVPFKELHYELAIVRPAV